MSRLPIARLRKLSNIVMPLHHLPMGGPVTVPADFMGMCFIRYPVLAENPIGVINYGGVRMSQQHGTRWSEIETAPGVYDWTVMDQYVTFQRQNAKTVYAGLYGTPRFYADNVTPNPTLTDYAQRGPWGLFGEGAMPTSLPALANFVVALITRYNLPGGAWYNLYGATLGKGIQAWETWNEPECWYYSSGGHLPLRADSDGRSGRFGWMTGPQLTDLHVTQYDAIKAIDASVSVTTPGFTSHTARWLARALTQVGPGTGKTMAATCDSVAWHPYLHTPLGWATFGQRYSDDLGYGAEGVFPMRAALAVAGIPNKPLRISEWGVDAGQTDPAIIDWCSRPPDYRRRWIARCFGACAALGVQQVAPWHWHMTGAVTTAGNYQNDVTGAQAGFNEAAANLPGRTITAAAYLPSGELRLTFASGPSWTI